MEEILDKIRSNDIKFIQMKSEDLHGASKELILDVDFFVSQVNLGVEFFKSGHAFTANGEYAPNSGIQDEIDFCNTFIYPDLDTFKILPWKRNTASVLVNFLLEPGNPESKYFSVSPRAICKEQLKRLKAKGLHLYGALEFEFYLLDRKTLEPAFTEINTCSSRLGNICIDFAQDVMQNMKELGIRPEAYHTEVGPGQLEITQRPSFGIKCPDNAFRFKHLTKEVALKHGYIATFMSKPFPDFWGSTAHFNQSLWNESGKNEFYDKDRPLGISELAEHWLAGLRHHSEALMCLACPTPNCYENITPGNLIPINNSWGLDNRTVAFRVKNYDASRTYVENRMAGGSVNPYLLTAGTIIAGLDGIDRKIKLGNGPLKGDATSRKDLPDDVKPLPMSLVEAIECLNYNEIFCKELGPEFLKCFTAVKTFECEKADQMKQEGKINKWYHDSYLQNL